MKHLIIYIILFILSLVQLYGQNFTGTITDTKGIALSGVSIYNTENKQGLISNDKGEFQTTLPSGSYIIEYKYPEYKNKIIRYTKLDSISISENIVLEKNNIEIADNNGIAELIIKNTINKVFEYRGSILQYKANAYVKGEMKFDKTSITTFKVGDYHSSELKNRRIDQEIYSQIKYNYPDKYQIIIKGISGNIPKNFNTNGALKKLTGSIYSEKFNEFISPVCHNATSYYEYKYAGYYIENDKITYKIKVHPKIKDPELVNGYLYIADSSWHIEYAMFESEIQGIKQNMFISYNNFGSNIILPISYLIQTQFDILGTEGNTTYYISLKYENLMPDKCQESLEENGYGYIDEIITESSAYNRDESFWTERRTLPLNVENLNDTVLPLVENKNSKFLSKLITNVVGGNYIHGNDTSKTSIRYSGVKRIFWDYNYVDGFWIGQRFEIKSRLSKHRSLEVYPYIYYLTARSRFIGGSNFIYNYFPKKQGQLALSIGSRSEDYNPLTITRYQNYFMSLFFGENYNFLYQKDFITASNSVNVMKNIKLNLEAGIAKRSGLSNHTDFRVFDRNHITENIYPNDRFDHTFYSIGFSFSPSSFPNINKNEELKEGDVNGVPVFHLEYYEGFSSWQKSNSKYRKLKGGIMQTIQINYFNKLDYKLEFGTFIGSKNKMHTVDYQYFGSSDLLINLNSLFDSFLLSDNYELKTNRSWTNMMLNYSSKYLLLKRIPFFHGRPFYESIHLKTLLTLNDKLYTELGYSVSITRTVGIGAFFSFDNIQLKKGGIKFSLNLKSLGLG